MLNPETITVIDPACGSGHILVEAYDVLKTIYLERGYQLRSIPRLILEKNLYGLDIDDRAAQLAGFALLMKARADDRRLFDELPKLNVYSIQSSKNLNLPLLWRQLDLNGQGKIGVTTSLFDEPQTGLVQVIDDSHYQLIKNTLALFEQAQTLGSLIQVPAEHAGPLKDLLAQLQALTSEGNNFQKIAATTLIPFIRQAVILGMQFDAVVANPPYMGGKGMNPALKEFAKREFPDSKSDLFAMFMERGFLWCKPSGFNAMVTMQSWMFLSSYQGMREKLLANRTINTMAHLGARAFSEISGEVVQTTAFVLLGQHFSGYKPAFFRLVDGQEEQKQAALCSGQNRFDTTVQDDFKKISGSPVAYWAGENVTNLFSLKKIFDISISEGQNKTSDNSKFVRLWWEIKANDIGRGKKWLSYAKGGDYRRWYGNLDYVVDWSDGARAHYRKDQSCRIIAEQLWYKPGISWTLLTAANQSFRLLPVNATFDMTGSSIFLKNDSYLSFALSLLNSCVSTCLLKILNPTVALQVRDVRNIPVIDLPHDKYLSIGSNGDRLIELSCYDWDSCETSFDFSNNQIIYTKQKKLESSYFKWQNNSQESITETQRLEEKNNRLFVDAYGLQDELSPEVPKRKSPSPALTAKKTARV